MNMQKLFMVKRKIHPPKIRSKAFIAEIKIDGVYFEARRKGIMKFNGKKFLMIFIEPTPYILDLLEKGFENISEQCDVVFLAQNLTQNWNLQLRAKKYLVCPSKKQILTLYFDVMVKRKYQLIHVAGWSNPYILLLILMSRLFFYPVTVESDTPLNPDLPTWKKVIKKCLYPFLFKLPAYFLPAGTRQAKYLMYYGVNSAKIKHAQMTVDVEYIQNYVKKISLLDRENVRAEHGANENDLVFLFVGRLLDWKGLRELIEAFELINEKNIKLWIVGDGQLADEIKTASQKNPNISYLGRISGDMLWSVYHAANVFVIPSHHEPWGLVVNEAMAAGLPVIATDSVGCIDDLISNNQQGLITPSKNTRALLEAMNFMLTNSVKKKRMADNASETIQSWNLKNEAGNMMACWEAVMME